MDINGIFFIILNKIVFLQGRCSWGMFLNPWYGGAQEGVGVGVQQLQQHQTALQLLQPILDKIQQQLRTGWTVHINRDGRFYYCK